MGQQASWKMHSREGAEVWCTQAHWQWPILPSADFSRTTSAAPEPFALLHYVTPLPSSLASKINWVGLLIPNSAFSIVSCHHQVAAAATCSAMNSPFKNEDSLFLQNDQSIWLHTSSSVNHCLYLTKQSLLLPGHVILGIFQGCPCAEIVLVHCTWPIR